jgi:hypothetical protein
MAGRYQQAGVGVRPEARAVQIPVLDVEGGRMPDDQVLDRDSILDSGLGC